MQGESAMLAVAIETAHRIAHGDVWVEPLLDGLIDVIGIDAGAGITKWRPNEPGPGGLDLIQRGVPPLSLAQAMNAMPFASEHPLMSLLASGGAYTAARVSDHVSMPQFWDSVVYQAVHGVTEGRFPASVSFGAPGGTVVFVGVQRHDRDFSDTEMQLMDMIRGPVAAALNFQAQLDYALARLQVLHATIEPADRPAAPPRGDALTARQRQVWAMVAAGCTNARISHILGISERTVRKHVEDLYLRLDVHSRATAAALWATTHARPGRTQVETAAEKVSLPAFKPC